MDSYNKFALNRDTHNMPMVFATAIAVANHKNPYVILQILNMFKKKCCYFWETEDVSGKCGGSAKFILLPLNCLANK